MPAQLVVIPAQTRSIHTRILFGFLIQWAVPRDPCGHVVWRPIFMVGTSLHFLLSRPSAIGSVSRSINSPSPAKSLRMFVRTDVVKPCPPDIRGHVRTRSGHDSGHQNRRFQVKNKGWMSGHFRGHSSKPIYINNLSPFLMVRGTPCVRTRTFVRTPRAAMCRRGSGQCSSPFAGK